MRLSPQDIYAIPCSSAAKKFCKSGAAGAVALQKKHANLLFQQMLKRAGMIAIRPGGILVH
jgi:hypothetical protein